MSAIDHQPPNNIEAEQAVLGSVLIEPDAIHKVAPLIKAEDFYHERHRWIWEAALALSERRQPPDYVSLVDELERRRKLEDIGGSSYIASLINVVPTAAHIETYAQIVERTSVLRRLIGAAGEIAALAYKGDGDLDTIIDKAEQAVFDVSQRRLQKELVPVSQFLQVVHDHVDYLRAHRGEMVGVPTGFSALDRLLGGLQADDLIIIAGRPSIGKTSFALNIALHAATHLPRKTVAVFSLEMAGEQIVQRLLANLAGIDGHRLRLGQVDGEEYDRMLEATGRLSESPLYIDDTPAISPTEIRSKARRLAAEQRLDLVVIDYLQLIRTTGRIENRVQEIAFISRSLKAMARELRVPVIALSQLSRAVEQHPEKRPQLQHLRESGALEQDADVVLFLYREDAYNETTEKRNIAEVNVAKHRNGPTGTVELYFQRSQSRFADLEYYRRDDADEAH